MTTPYTDADVQIAAEAAYESTRSDMGDGHWKPWRETGEPLRAEFLTEARASLDALAAAGRLAHDCERRPCPFEDLWNASDPKPDDALVRLQSAFNDVVAELSEIRAEAKGARDDYEQLRGINAELADERDRLRQLLDQNRSGVARAIAITPSVDEVIRDVNRRNKIARQP